MRFLFALSFVVVMFVFSRFEARSLEILSHKEKVYRHTDCQATQTCSLKRVGYTVQDYRIRVDGADHRGTRLFAFYETDTVPALEEYVFVQFIKGCVYSSEMRNGVLRTYRDIVTSHLGHFVPFFFREWSVDSINGDPAYFSMNTLPRHFFYSWQTEGGKLRWYGKEKPVIPRLTITDHPSQTFVISGWARNVLLQFRTCLYRARDVPVSAGQNDIDFGQPIHCFSWQNLSVYDHTKNIFERPRKAPSCP